MMGQRIAALRRQAGLTQTELARRIYVSPSAIGMYEKGKREPSVEILSAIARELDVPLDYLISGKGNPIPDITAVMADVMERSSDEALPAGEFPQEQIDSRKLFIIELLQLLDDAVEPGGVRILQIKKFAGGNAQIVTDIEKAFQ